MATKREPYLVVDKSFHSPDGFIHEGEVYEYDHPIVQKYPERFKSLDVHRAKRAPVVESATSAPGEKRGR
jgi:hypothetical protein